MLGHTSVPDLFFWARANNVRHRGYVSGWTPSRVGLILVKVDSG